MQSRLFHRTSGLSWSFRSAKFQWPVSISLPSPLHPQRTLKERDRTIQTRSSGPANLFEGEAEDRLQRSRYFASQKHDNCKILEISFLSEWNRCLQPIWIWSSVRYKVLAFLPGRFNAVDLLGLGLWRCKLEKAGRTYPGELQGRWFHENNGLGCISVAVCLWRNQDTFTQAGYTLLGVANTATSDVQRNELLAREIYSRSIWNLIRDLDRCWSKSKVRRKMHARLSNLSDDASRCGGFQAQIREATWLWRFPRESWYWWRNNWRANDVMSSKYTWVFAERKDMGYEAHLSCLTAQL